MSTILIIVLVILLLGGFGGYHGYNRYGRTGLGGVLGLVLIILIVVWSSADSAARISKALWTAVRRGVSVVKIEQTPSA
jgi:hypothetical protein